MTANKKKAKELKWAREIALGEAVQLHKRNYSGNPLRVVDAAKAFVKFLTTKHGLEGEN